MSIAYTLTTEQDETETNFIQPFLTCFFLYIAVSADVTLTTSIRQTSFAFHSFARYKDKLVFIFQYTLLGTVKPHIQSY